MSSISNDLEAAADVVCDLFGNQRLDLSLPGFLGQPGKTRVLVAEAYNVTPHLETGLEIALRLARSGYIVDYLHFGNNLSYVEYYFRDRWRLKELLCWTLAPQRKGIAVIKIAALRMGLRLNIVYPRSSLFGHRHSIPSYALESIQSLKVYDPCGYPCLGQSVASSLVSQRRDHRVKPFEHQSFCQRLASSYVQSFHIIDHAMAVNRYQAVVLFNGRQAFAKGAVAAANSHKVPIFYHERGSSSGAFSLRTYQPHDRLALQRDILSTWSSLELTDVHFRTASEYFEKKKIGVDGAWTSFTTNHKVGLSRNVLGKAKDLSRSGLTVTYFVSSDNELESVGEVFQRDLADWTSQADAVNALASMCFRHGHSLIVRVHPHLSQIASARLHEWQSLEFIDPCYRNNIVLVDSSSPVSTYELIDGSDLIVSCGSTVGIEAVYWGKPSLLLMNSFYDCLGAVDRAFDYSSLDRYLCQSSWPCPDRAKSLPYGYYMQTFGFPYLIYQPISLFDGAFAGLKLQTFDRSPVFRILRHFISLFPKRSI